MRAPDTSLPPVREWPGGVLLLDQIISERHLDGRARAHRVFAGNLEHVGVINGFLAYESSGAAEGIDCSGFGWQCGHARRVFPVDVDDLAPPPDRRLGVA